MGNRLRSGKFRALILYRLRRFINHLLTYLLTYLNHLGAEPTIQVYSTRPSLHE